MKHVETLKLIQPDPPAQTFHASSSRTSSSRYIVSFVIGFDSDTEQGGGCTIAAEAAERALGQVLNGNAVFTVFDRETGEYAQFVGKSSWP